MAGIKNGFTNFSEISVLSFLLLIFGIFLNHGFLFSNVILKKINMVLILGIPLFSYSKLLTERCDKRKIRLLTNSILLLFLIFFYFNIPFSFNDNFMIRYFILIIISVLGMISIYSYNKENISLQVLGLINNFIVTGLFSVFLYLGITAMIFTVGKLFEVLIYEKIYFDIFLVVVGLFSINYFFAKFPIQKRKDKMFQYPSIFIKLFFYIVIPLIMIYSFILYLYFLRIIVLNRLPINLVAHLVLWYGFVSVIVLFFINQIKYRNKYVKLFYKYFPVIISIPLAMLFWAIRRRVTNFGMTTPRYFVIIMGLWITISMLIIFFSKKRKQMRIIVTTIILLFVSIYGPINTFYLSKTSQINRLKKVLKKNDMLEEGRIVINKYLSTKDKDKICDLVDYFSRNYDFKKIGLFPKNFDKSKMEKYFGFKYMTTYSNNQNIIKYTYKNTNRDNIFDVQDYDYFLKFETNLEKAKTYQIKNISVKYDSIKKNIEINKNSQKVIDLSILTIINDFNKKHKNQNIRNLKDATVIFKNDKVQIKMLINSIYYNKLKKSGRIQFDFAFVFMDEN